MGSSSMQRLLEAIARYDREIEPLAFRLDTYRLELRPFLDGLMDRLAREHSDDPEFLKKINGFRKTLRSRIGQAAARQ